MWYCFIFMISQFCAMTSNEIDPAVEEKKKQKPQFVGTRATTILFHCSYCVSRRNRVVSDKLSNITQDLNLFSLQIFSLTICLIFPLITFNAGFSSLTITWTFHPRILQKSSILLCCLCFHYTLCSHFRNSSFSHPLIQNKAK